MAKISVNLHNTKFKHNVLVWGKSLQSTVIDGYCYSQYYESIPPRHPPISMFVVLKSIIKLAVSKSWKSLAYRMISKISWNLELLVGSTNPPKNSSKIKSAKKNNGDDQLIAYQWNYVECACFKLATLLIVKSAKLFIQKEHLAELKQYSTAG